MTECPSDHLLLKYAHTYKSFQSFDWAYPIQQEARDFDRALTGEFLFTVQARVPELIGNTLFNEADESVIGFVKYVR